MKVIHKLKIGGTMYLYQLNISKLPLIRDFYKIQRNTIWSQADPNHVLIIILEGKCLVVLKIKNIL